MSEGSGGSNSGDFEAPSEEEEDEAAASARESEKSDGGSASSRRSDAAASQRSRKSGREPPSAGGRSGGAEQVKATVAERVAHIEQVVHKEAVPDAPKPSVQTSSAGAAEAPLLPSAPSAPSAPLLGASQDFAEGGLVDGQGLMSAAPTVAGMGADTEGPVSAFAASLGEAGGVDLEDTFGRTAGCELASHSQFGLETGEVGLSATGGSAGREAQIGRAACELVSLVRPSKGEPSRLQEIWSKVAEEGAQLPGSWDETLSGALDAARCGDWTLCAYLAARCFIKHGGADGGGAKALEAPDERCSSTLWLEVAAPVVLEVPRGQERLCVRFEDGKEPEWLPTDQIGTGGVSPQGLLFARGRGRGRLVAGVEGSAEHFNVGATLELSQLQWRKTRLRRLLMEDEARLALRRLLVQRRPEEEPRPAFLDKKVPTAHVPGIWYHVLAFPLGGDPTKALLRPVSRSWAPGQRESAERAVRHLGETLAAQCAKAGQWDLVEVLFKAGVSCPELAREFEDVCGVLPVLRRQWRRDMLPNCGRIQSLLELAATVVVPPPRAMADASPMLRVLNALRPHGLADLGADPAGRRPPLILATAMAERWDVVRSLLRLPQDLLVCAESFLESTAAFRAPQDVLELADARRQIEAGQPRRPRTLREYFERRISGEVMGHDLVPHGFKLEDGALRCPGGVEVLDLVLNLAGVTAPGTGAEVLFVALSPSDVGEARAAEADRASAILPLNLSGRTAAVQDAALASSEHWLAVLAPAGYLRRSESGVLRLVVPQNCLPLPNIVRAATVRVTVETPCCGAPLPDVAIFASRRQVGVTDQDGTATFDLPPGRHLLSAPSCSAAEVVLVVQSGSTGALPVRLPADGELFLYLQDLTYDDVCKDGVYLSCNRNKFAEEAEPFEGDAKLPGGLPPPSRMGERFVGVARVAPGTRCSESLKALQPQTTDGRSFQRDEDLAWFDDFQSECQVALLFSNLPIRIGNLLGRRRGQQPPTPKAATGSSGAGRAAEREEAVGARELAEELGRRLGGLGLSGLEASIMAPVQRPSTQGSSRRASSAAGPARQLAAAAYPPFQRARGSSARRDAPGPFGFRPGGAARGSRPSPCHGATRTRLRACPLH